MNGQRGSALIGVLSLGLAMTIAASGYVMIASSVGRSIPDEEVRAQMHYDAESALRLGLRWMKKYTNAPGCNTWPADLVLSQGVDNGWISLNASTVKVSLEPGAPGGGCRTIRAFAKRTGMETIELSIQINSPLNPTPSTTTGPQPLCDLALSKWTETVHPEI